MASLHGNYALGLLVFVVSAACCWSEPLAAATADASSLLTAEDINQRPASLAASRKLMGYRPIPIDTSVVLLFMSDVEGGDSSPCVQMVKRALEFQGRSINFFVTGYYADYNGDNQVDALGYKESQNDKSFKPYDYNAAYRFSKGLTVST